MKAPIGFVSAAALAAALVSAPLARAGTTTTHAAVFVKQAIAGNLSEIKVGELAQRKGATEGVRHFGEVLEQDHSKANQQAIAAASSMGVTPPSEPTPKEQRIYQHLASLSGAKFDKAFVKAMVKDHEQDIAKYTREAKATNSPASNYAEAVLPDLHKHLRIAESLQRNPGG
jgi:putative membrane protein